MKSKTINLLSLLGHRPTECWERLTQFGGSRLEPIFNKRPIYNTFTAEDGISAILRSQNSDPTKLIGERALARVEEQVQRRKTELPADAPFAKFHNGDALLGRLCYAVARALRPAIVAETGVCYGVTSAYVLAALQVNDQGQLYSIDLPPLGKDGDDYVGWLVPTELRSRWSLRRGTSGRLLRPLLKELAGVDLFIHDSLHTYRNMKMEFAAAWPALRAGGVMISDDVEGNAAFLELTKEKDVAFSVVIREQGKNAMLGVAVKNK